MLNSDPYASHTVPPGDVGRGYGAKDLEAMRLQGLVKQLSESRPDLKEQGLALAVLRLRLEEAEEAFRIELRNGVGGDFVTDALKMFRGDAEKLWSVLRGKAKPIADVAKAALAKLSAGDA